MREELYYNSWITRKVAKLMKVDSDREEPVLVERSRSAARSSGYHNRTNEDGSRRAAMRSTIEGSGVCTGSDIERKPCDAGPCCSWNSWNEWSTCTECDPQSVSRRSRMCKMIESTAVFTPIAAQLDYHHRKAGGGGGAPRLLDIYTTGILKPMTPIVPVNHRKRRQAPSPQTGMELSQAIWYS
ncbi:hypothetical protein Y032_0314g2216 [Ancylostoma ceylanicum]|uniref:Thrombospondin type 1 domain protein n=1 Tax=Ancylostoma ceylanicum TaxID=53326 RepID=A0A016S250_9BILA|nr:hypothetical protein Y032_0314g2216 [Ancylostoma ceylanicum]